MKSSPHCQQKQKAYKMEHRWNIKALLIGIYESGL